MWIHGVDDLTNPFSSEKVAIDRAMAKAHCASGYDFDTAKLQNFPIGGGNPDTTCQRIDGCDTLYPLVVCPLPGPDRYSHDNVVNPGWSVFLKLFQNGLLLTQ